MQKDENGMRFADRMQPILRVIKNQNLSEEQVKVRIKDIVAEIDEDNRDTIASLLISTYKHETKERWLFAGLSVVTVLALVALILSLFRFH